MVNKVRYGRTQSSWWQRMRALSPHPKCIDHRKCILNSEITELSKTNQDESKANFTTNCLFGQRKMNIMVWLACKSRFLCSTRIPSHTKSHFVKKLNIICNSPHITCNIITEIMNLRAGDIRHICMLWWCCNVWFLMTITLSLTHWGRVAHIWVSKRLNVGSDYGLLPGRRQAIIWTNIGIYLIKP